MESFTIENQMLFFALYTIVGIVGVAANILVIQTFWKDGRKLFFHMQLALVNIFSLAIIAVIGPSALRGKFIFGDSVCRYTGFHAFLFGFAEINFTCLVCFECLVAVVKKPEYKQWLSDKMMHLSVASWLYALVFSVAPFFGWGRYTYEKTSTSCGIDLNRRVVHELPYLVTASILFGVMITAAIVVMGMARWRNSDLQTQSFHPLISDVELVKICTALLGILAVCSLPYALRVFHYIRGGARPFSSFVGVEFSHLSMKLICCLQPMVYFVFSEEFQRKAKYTVTGLDVQKKNH